MIRGGLRTRLVGDSVRLAVIDGLTALGWFDGTVYDDPPGPRHHLPLRYVPRPVAWYEDVEPNAIAISTEDVRSRDLGLGGDVEDNLRMYVDIFAQNDEFGWHLAHDVRDLLQGKLPDIGRYKPSIDVYDLRQPTPAAFTAVDVEDLIIDRAASESRSWRNQWFMVRFDTIDEYYDEADPVHVSPAAWNARFNDVWVTIQEIEGP